MSTFSCSIDSSTSQAKLAKPVLSTVGLYIYSSFYTYFQKYFFLFWFKHCLKPKLKNQLSPLCNILWTLQTTKKSNFGFVLPVKIWKTTSKVRHFSKNEKCWPGCPNSKINIPKCSLETNCLQNWDQYH